MNLSEWSGDWISAIEVMTKEHIDNELKSVYEELGKIEGITACMWKANKFTAWDSNDIKLMMVYLDSIEFNFKNGNKITNIYKYKGNMTTFYKNRQKLKWFLFEGDKSNDYRFLALRPSGKQDEFSHFHFRNSAKGFKYLENTNIYKTMVSHNTTAKQLAIDFTND